MMRLVLICLTVFLGLVAQTPAQAQIQAEDEPLWHEKTLPIEIAMLYKKLLKIEPDYNALIYSNPSYVEDPLKFGQQALIEQQRGALEKIFNETSADKLIYDQRDIVYLGVGPNGSIMLETQNPDEPIVYSLFEKEKYGVFIRNLKDIETMLPPFEASNTGQMFANAPVFAELTLKPVTADSNDFIQEDGTPLKTIVTDVVEIKLLPGDQPFLGIQKRLNGWSPNPVQSSSTLFQPELLESLNKKKK